MDAQNEPTPTVDDTFDPIATLKQREKAEEEAKAEKKRQEEIETAKRAKEDRLNVLKIPQMRQQLFEEINASYPVLKRVDLPQMQANVELIDVLDKLTEAPQVKPTLRQRITGTVPNAEPPKAHTSQRACWRVAYILSEKIGLVYLYLGINDGAMYTASSRARHSYAVPLEEKHIQKLSFHELQELIEGVRRHREGAERDLEIKRLLAETKRIAAHMAKPKS